MHGFSSDGFMILYCAILMIGPFGGVASAAPCSQCHDHSDLTLPDTLVWMPGLNTAESLSCQFLSEIIPILFPDETKPECQMLQKFANICGCPPVLAPDTDGCGGLCPPGISIDPNRSNVVLEQFGRLFPNEKNSRYNCQLMDALLASTPKNDTFCRKAQISAAETCGCPPIDGWIDLPHTDDDEDSALNGFSDVPSLWLGFLGTKTPEQIHVLYTLARVAAFFSATGSLLVIQDCIRDAQRRSHVYNQIVGIMASFDIVHSIAIGLQQLARPKQGFLQYPGDGQKGSDGTCKAQGWFIQWGGMTSLFLNGALSTYYVLVIMYNTREARLKRWRKHLLGPPLAAGLIIASASLPYIGPSYYGGCFLVAPHPGIADLYLPEGTRSWWSYISLFLFPGWFVVLYSTVALVLVWLHVRKVRSRAKRWSFPTAASTSSTSHRSLFRRSKQRRPEIDRLEREVALQSAFYLAALYFTWVLSLVIATNLEEYIISYFELWVLFFVSSPLQGLLNSLNYFRPRISRLFQEMRKRNHRTDGVQPQQNQSQGSRFFRDWKVASSVEPANKLADLVNDDETESQTGADGYRYDDPVPSVELQARSGDARDDSASFSANWKAASAVEPANEIVRWNSTIDHSSCFDEAVIDDANQDDADQVNTIVSPEATTVLSPVDESEDD